MTTSAFSGYIVEGTKQNTLSPRPLTELNSVLGDFEPLAVRIAELKKDTLESEAQVLAAILTRMTPLVPALSKDYEPCYRREIVIIGDTEQMPLEQGAYFYSENKLILYENGSLVRMHRYGEFTGSNRPGWELVDELPFTALAAVEAFGLNAIATALVRMLKDASEMVILKEELEARLIALARVLEALR